jgi:hypothetical protein
LAWNKGFGYICRLSGMVCSRRVRLLVTVMDRFFAGAFQFPVKKINGLLSCLRHLPAKTGVISVLTLSSTGVQLFTLRCAGPVATDSIWYNIDILGQPACI